MWEDLHRVKSSRAYITRSVKSGLALKCFILIGWQDFVGVTAVTYLIFVHANAPDLVVFVRDLHSLKVHAQAA